MKQFKSLEALAADMYYYNHIGGDKVGFSIPFEDNGRFDGGGSSGIKFGCNIVELYVRLGEYAPIIKMELIGMTIEYSESDINHTMEMLYHHSVSGYPPLSQTGLQQL